MNSILPFHCHACISPYCPFPSFIIHTSKAHIPGGGGGALQYQMDTGVRLTLPKAVAIGEDTVSKNEGSLGEKPNFGSKWGGGHWVRVLLLIFQ